MDVEKQREDEKENENAKFIDDKEPAPKKPRISTNSTDLISNNLCLQTVCIASTSASENDESKVVFVLERCAPKSIFFLFFNIYFFTLFFC